MADQVNPLGSLTPGLTPALAAFPTPAQPGVDRSPQERPSSPVEASIASGAKPAAEAPPAQSKRSNASNLEDATKTLRAFLKTLPSDLQFREDYDSGKVFFKVVNPVTREVIRQIPSEEILAMARKLKELDPNGAKGPGLLLDQKG